MPEQIPTHFNVRGEADDWARRSIGAFMMPLFGLLLYGVFHLLPKISPRKTNLDRDVLAIAIRPTGLRVRHISARLFTRRSSVRWCIIRLDVTASNA